MLHDLAHYVARFGNLVARQCFHSICAHAGEEMTHWRKPHSLPDSWPSSSPANLAASRRPFVPELVRSAPDPIPGTGKPADGSGRRARKPRINSADMEFASMIFAIFVLGIPSIGITFLLLGWLIFFS